MAGSNPLPRYPDRSTDAYRSQACRQGVAEVVVSLMTGFGSMVGAFLAMLRGENQGKMIVEL